MPIVSIDEINLLHNTICQAVGDPKRIQILYALSDHPMNVTALAEALDTPQPTISRHLSLLRQRGLVSTERDGVSVTYSVAATGLIDILDAMRHLLREVMEKQATKLED